MYTKRIGSATVRPAPVAGWMVDWALGAQVVDDWDKAVRLAHRKGIGR